MNIGTKKGLGIITCHRPEYFEQIINSTFFDDVDGVYVYDSSETINKYVDGTDTRFKLISGDAGATVGVAKNALLKAMKDDGMEHLFLQEDDVKITKPEVFDAYIQTAMVSGLWGSLNYAWHGSSNKDNLGIPIIKNSIDYENGLGIEFTQHGSASFSYIHTKIIDVVGYHDEFYENCWEHLDFFLRQSNLNLASCWWWFTDIKDSSQYFIELDNSELDNSVIRKDPKWLENMNIGVKYFQDKFGFKPNLVPHADESQVLSKMKKIKNLYGSK